MFLDVIKKKKKECLSNDYERRDRLRANNVSDGVIPQGSIQNTRDFLALCKEKNPSEYKKGMPVLEHSGASQMKPHQLPICAHQCPLRAGSLGEAN